MSSAGFSRLSMQALRLEPDERTEMTAKPEIVSAEEWEQARGELLVAEKQATRTLDALAARRRRLPMVKFADSYVFDTPTGPKSLAELFDGRDQLVVYQFMNLGPDRFCPGCTGFVNNIPTRVLTGLAGAGVAWVVVSDMPVAQIEGYKAKMGWTLPFVSSQGTSFAADSGAGGGFVLSVFLRDGDDVYRTYSTTARGVDRLVFANNILDLSPYGRQEEWEDSPPGWPQTPTYTDEQLELLDRKDPG
jgi:predicted dithiol-disulfide oxidoreductase (DUF899 family)